LYTILIISHVWSLNLGQLSPDFGEKTNRNKEGINRLP